MKILEFMSFNPSWFFSLPGILITVGVILLIIALILLLTKDKDKELEKTENGVKPNNDYEFKPLDATNTQAPAQDAISIGEQSNVQSEQVQVPQVSETQLVVEAQPKIEIFEPTTPAQTVLKEMENRNINPTVAVPEVTSNSNVSIYGGTNPMTTVENTTDVKPEKATIYGGANPLENTAPMPVVDNKSEPYNVTTPETINIEQKNTEIEELTF